MDARLPTFLLVAVLVSGCAGSRDSGAPTPNPSPDASAANLFLPPVTAARDSSEPGLLIDRAGTVWVHAPGGLWKSDAAGASFTEIDFKPGVVLGGDADLAIGKDGSLYYTDLEELAAISVFASHDGGSSWQEQPIASDAPLDDRQWITNGPDAGPLSMGKEAVYLAYNQLASGIWVTKSTDGGVTWTPNLAFATSRATAAEIQTMGNVVVDAKGLLYVAFTIGSAGAPAVPPIGPNMVVVLASQDGGVTWTRHDVYSGAASPSNIFTILAVDPKGTVYAAWAMEQGGTTDVFLSHSKDGAATWSKPLKVNRHVGSHVLPWVSSGNAPGELALVWYESSDKAAPKDVKGEWHVEIAATRNGDADVPTFAEGPVTGPVHKKAVCVDGILCSGGRQLGDFFETRITPDDRLHVSYIDDYVGGAKANYVRGAAPWTEQVWPRD